MENTHQGQVDSTVHETVCDDGRALYLHSPNGSHWPWAKKSHGNLEFPGSEERVLVLTELKSPISTASASRGDPTMGKQSQQQAPSFTVSSVNSNLYFILINK